MSEPARGDGCREPVGPAPQRSVLPLGSRAARHRITGSKVVGEMAALPHHPVRTCEHTARVCLVSPVKDRRVVTESNRTSAATPVCHARIVDSQDVRAG